MRNLLETQFSWLAVFMTAFYSLLASCRGAKCGPDELGKCSAPLAKLTEYVSTKDTLMELCPSLQDAIRCTKKYTTDCMNIQERRRFINLYTETNMAIAELCQEGRYQEEFLKHSDCMQAYTADYEKCSTNYEKEMIRIEQAGHKVIENVCCTFQTYLQCSHGVVKKRCGEEAANFTKQFLDRMSNSLITTHCDKVQSECQVTKVPPNSANRNWSSNLIVAYLTPVVLVTMARILA